MVIEALLLSHVPNLLGYIHNTHRYQKQLWHMDIKSSWASANLSDQLPLLPARTVTRDNAFFLYNGPRQSPYEENLFGSDCTSSVLDDGLTVPSTASKGRHTLNQPA